MPINFNSPFVNPPEEQNGQQAQAQPNQAAPQPSQQPPVIQFGQPYGMYSPYGYKTRQLGTLGAVIFILVGLGIGYFGYYQYSSASRLEAIGVHTTGTVQNVLTQYSNSTQSSGYYQTTSNNVSYVPVVQFTDKNSNSITFNGSGSSNTNYYKGESVPVIYDPSAPNNAMIDSATNKLAPMGIMLFGALFAILGLATIITKIWKKQPQQQQ